MKHFNFSKKERNGTFILLFLIILFITIPFLLPFFIKPENHDFKKIDGAITQLKQQPIEHFKHGSDKRNDTGYDTTINNKLAEHTKIELFYFNPNTLPDEGWKKLGIRDKTISTIHNYLSKGGKFYKPEDIGKIWEIRKEEADRLIPYIKIEQPGNPKEYKSYNNKAFPTNINTTNHKVTLPKIDINTADTSLFIALPGIASKLANRIITFRNKLGGFYKVDQIAETFGLRDSVFQLIKPLLFINNTRLTQFNINTATVDELKQHPYIRYAIANSIVQYRAQHGNFLNIADVKKITLVTDEVFDKMAPYLKVD